MKKLLPFIPMIIVIIVGLFLVWLASQPVDSPPKPSPAPIATITPAATLKPSLTPTKPPAPTLTPSPIPATATPKPTATTTPTSTPESTRPASPIATPSPTPEILTPVVIPRTDAVRARSGPALEYPILGLFDNLESSVVLGQHGDWLLIYHECKIKGWVFGDLVELVSGSLDSVAEVEAPPLYDSYSSDFDSLDCQK